MPRCSVCGDGCSGHECFPPRNNVEGSPNVIVTGSPAHRVGDGWATHCCTCPWIPHGCHDSVLCSGSPNVFTNGKPQGRLGDAVCCGGIVVGPGASTVIING